MRTGVPEVIVLEAAFGTLWASERKRETYYLVYILWVDKNPGCIVVILKMSENVAGSYKLKIGLV